MAYTTINKSSAYMDTCLWDGNNSTSDRNITTGVNGADLVWTKRRNNTYPHMVFDSVRTFAGDKGLSPHDQTEEGSVAAAANGYIGGTGDSFITLKEGSGDIAYTNASGGEYAAWSWKAGTTSGLSGGTITPSAYSINTTSKFGIYKYTGNGTNGATIAHGLGATPTFMIFKKTSGTDDWKVYHKSIGAAKSIRLDSTDSESSDSTLLNSTAPTSTLITLGTSSAINTNSETYICYAFCDVQGYCKTGKYTANNSTDGNFIPTGHKPKLFMLKAYTGGSSNSRNWLLYDDNRNGINSSTSGYENRSLRPNKTDTEASASGYYIDILSQGVKLRSNSGELNTSGESYIYFSIGQSTVGTNNVPTTAR